MMNDGTSVSSGRCDVVLNTAGEAQRQQVTGGYGRCVATASREMLGLHKLGLTPRSTRAAGHRRSGSV